MTLTTQPNEIVLSEEQQKAIDQILTFFKDPTKKEYKLGGYAGTGKTTIIKFLIAHPNSGIRPIICAFTGKACHVLRKKGIHEAQTIHSKIYDCYEDPPGIMNYDLKTILEGRPNLIIVDEASMLSLDLYKDLKSFNIKLLFIGDPGQLEPVGEDAHLMKQPDYVLSKIHRQAELSPIITLATNTRQGFPVRLDDPTRTVNIKPKFITDGELAEASQVICAKNATRSLLNNRVRNHLKRIDKIEVGEKLICLRNNRRYGMFNGLICYVEDYIDKGDFWACTLRDEVDKIYSCIPIWKKPFISTLDENDRCPIYCIQFDYGYAITCHKSQGSEWEHVLVYDEVMYKTDMKRWRYTAITRASEKLTYCI